MKKTLITLLFVCSIATVGNAQYYSTGIGLRGGFHSGISLKHFISDNKALEGIVSMRWKGLCLGGLYEVHQPVFDADGLNWYYGFGGHLGFWDGDDVSWIDDGDNHMVLGVDGIIGIEYTFQDVPINIGLDWKPTIRFFGDVDIWGDGGALTIRYVF